MPLDQVVPAIHSPFSPGRLVLAFITNIVLELVATALAIPGVLINGDTDPRVLGRASSVTDRNTFRHRNTVGIPRVVSIAVTWNLLAKALFRLAGTTNGNICLIGIVRISNVTDKASAASTSGDFSVDQVPLATGATVTKLAFVLIAAGARIVRGRDAVVTTLEALVRRTVVARARVGRASGVSRLRIRHSQQRGDENQTRHNRWELHPCNSSLLFSVCQR